MVHAGIGWISAAAAREKAKPCPSAQPNKFRLEGVVLGYAQFAVAQQRFVAAALNPTYAVTTG
jgi:hypothetical protein